MSFSSRFLLNCVKKNELELLTIMSQVSKAQWRSWNLLGWASKNTIKTNHFPIFLKDPP